MAKFVSQFSPELCKLESLNVVYVCRRSDCIVGLRLRVMAFIFLFLSIFLSFPILHVNIKKFYVGIFSGTFAAKMLNLGIHMDNFKAKFVSQFSPELCKLKSSNMVY